MTAVPPGPPPPPSLPYARLSRPRLVEKCVAPGVRADSSETLMTAPGSMSWGPCVLRSDCGAE